MPLPKRSPSRADTQLRAGSTLPRVASTEDTTDITPPSSIRIGPTPVGRGVIAAADIAKGEIIEVVPVLEVDEADSDGVLADYVVDRGDDGPGAILMLGYGSLNNHSEDPNAEYVIETDDAYAF